MLSQDIYYFIGFMGCGKTYWGQKISALASVEFIDLDKLIIEKVKNSIPQIFQLYGEDGFREIESAWLRSIKSDKITIVATGGGTPCHHQNMEWMKHRGKTIYLKTPISLLTGRLKKQMNERPLLRDIQPENLDAYIAQKLKERSEYYEQADIILHQNPQNNQLFEQLLLKEIISER
ncbi:MAG: shikimate kinase [Saprospiraceae bacterium]|nr:shikimate kinase [Saprospiraceae bacterium]